MFSNIQAQTRFTRSFVRAIPLWATLVGLEYRDETIAGVVEVPTLGQTFRALRGDGAYRGQWGTKGTAAGQFSRPKAVAVDATGGIFVAATEKASR